MGKPLSIDLRSRLVSAVAGGMSRRSAAQRFGVSAASAVRWVATRTLPRFKHIERGEEANQMEVEGAQEGTILPRYPALDHDLVNWAKTDHDGPAPRELSFQIQPGSSTLRAFA